MISDIEREKYVSLLFLINIFQFSIFSLKIPMSMRHYSIKILLYTWAIFYVARVLKFHHASNKKNLLLIK